MFSDLPRLEVLETAGLKLRLQEVNLPALHTLKYRDGAFVYDKRESVTPTTRPTLDSGHGRAEGARHPEACRCSACSLKGPILAVTVKVHDVLRAFPALRTASIQGAQPNSLAATSRALAPAGAERPFNYGITALELHECHFARPQIPEFWAPFCTHLKHLRLIRPTFNGGSTRPALVEAGVLAMLRALGSNLETFEWISSQPLGSLAISLLSNCKSLRIKTSYAAISSDVVYALPSSLEYVHVAVPDSLDFYHQFIEGLQLPTHLPNLKEVPYCHAERGASGTLMEGLHKAQDALEKRGLQCNILRLEGSLLYKRTASAQGASAYPRT